MLAISGHGQSLEWGRAQCGVCLSKRARKVQGSLFRLLGRAALFRPLRGGALAGLCRPSARRALCWCATGFKPLACSDSLLLARGLLRRLQRLPLGLLGWGRRAVSASGRGLAAFAASASARRFPRHGRRQLLLVPPLLAPALLLRRLLLGRPSTRDFFAVVSGFTQPWLNVALSAATVRAVFFRPGRAVFHCLRDNSRARYRRRP